MHLAMVASHFSHFDIRHDGFKLDDDQPVSLALRRRQWLYWVELWRRQLHGTGTGSSIAKLNPEAAFIGKRSDSDSHSAVTYNCQLAH